MTSSEINSSFPIPLTLSDLEREPYSLLPYPYDFNDDDEAARADSFVALVEQLSEGNRILQSADFILFHNNREDGERAWMDDDRMQALYTLVRKSTSLAPLTRIGLVKALHDAVHFLSKILADNTSKDGGDTAPQLFRDAFACHVYMLYSFMFLLESDAKGKNTSSEDIIQIRQIAASAMLMAAETMALHKSTLWQRGVPDEAVTLLPCRIAYPVLELATGIMARKASCGDHALRMIAITVDAYEPVLSSVTAALMDLMHSFEHMPSLVAELCTMVNEDPVNRLAIELVREFGRIDGNEAKAAVGVKNVAPFISDLALLRPRIVLLNVSHVLPHLNSEQYNLRSSIIAAVSHLVAFLAKQKQEDRTNFENNETENYVLSISHEKSIHSLFQILHERCHDVSSYTRAATLKAWVRLTEIGTIPRENIIEVTKLAMDRLQDKTVVVRKQAMQLLTTLLENNPFMGNLDPEPFRFKLRELYDSVKSNLPEHLKEAHEAAISGADEQNIAEVEQSTLAAAISEADNLLKDESIELSTQQQDYCRKVQALKFTLAAIEFIELFECSTKALEGMLLSANNSDVTEALRFFVQARHFKLPCAVSGMKRALALMWSTEQSIRDEVLKAFVDVFVAVPGSEGSQVLPPKDIALNLLVLVGQASVSESASIEEAIVRLVKEEKLSGDVFRNLWSISSKNKTSRAAAIQLIGMGATADRNIIDTKSHLKTLLDEGFCDFSNQGNDWKLVCNIAICLQRLGRATVEPSDAKYLVLEQIVNELCKIVSGDACQDDSQNDTLEWFSAAEQAIKALFVICPEPEVICNSIIVTMATTTFDKSSQTSHTLRLARFFHVIGTIALNLLVYSEALIGCVRRATATKSLKKQEDADKAKSQKKITKSASSETDDNMEAELGIAAAAEAENERQLVDISENEILGRGLISQFAPLLVRVVGDESATFNSVILAQSATLALCKFMCVSSSFCEKHLPLLFTALMNAPLRDITFRANTVVALGDIAFRFPNEFEPYTPRLYACLRDASTKVRRHALMVLTHLILNDMIKVKGQVCEIALCLKDDDPRIRDMSRLLFHELSKRSNNPIYNLLPDIISQLSQTSVQKEDFRQIMSTLLSYITKDRQFEMLTEKLCQRFPACSSMRQKADLAYCLSQIKLTEKCFKCLSDNFKLYKEALFDEDVMKSFHGIVIKAKKIPKPEMKEFIEEWELKLNESATLGTENNLVNEKAAQARKKAPRRGKAKVKEFDGESQDVHGFTETAHDKENISAIQSRNKSTGGRKKMQALKVVSDDEEDNEKSAEYEFEFDDDGEDDDSAIEVHVPVTKSRKRSTKSKRIGAFNG